MKKRVPLGMGYPDYETLTKAVAEFIIKEIYDEDLPTKIHFIYTGIPETKYKDCLQLYYEITKELINLMR